MSQVRMAVSFSCGVVALYCPLFLILTGFSNFPYAMCSYSYSFGYSLACGFISGFGLVNPYGIITVVL